MTLNCGAIPPSLIEAQLFGYVGGAFTGAEKNGKPGLIETADGGSLFLDEIDSFPIEAQVKLLTFLDTQTFLRVGGTKVQEVDVRLICATNKNLTELVSQNLFREDLWFRLNVVPLSLPPLSDRRADIAPLIQSTLAKLAKRHRTKRRITPDAVEALNRYEFPGNVRELENVIERAFVLCEGDRIHITDLAPEIRRLASADRVSLVASTLSEALAAVEHEWLLRACDRYSRQLDIAAELGVSQPTVMRLLKRHGLKPTKA